MSSLLPLLLHWFTVFIAAVGIPLPISLVLLVLGAFAGYGDFHMEYLKKILLILQVIQTTPRKRSLRRCKNELSPLIPDSRQNLV